MRVPKLHRHVTGNYFCKWGGKFHYFGTDLAVAEQRYSESLREWMDWRESKLKARRPARRRLTCQQVADQFFDSRRVEVGLDAERYYRKHLKRFLEKFGVVDADLIEPQHLHAIKLDSLDWGLAPKTVNHDLTAIRVMFNWASGVGIVPPVNLKGVKNAPVGPVQDRTLTEDQVAAMLGKANAKLKPWLAVNYLALLRPSEVVRCVNGHGEWKAEGVFQLDRGKMDERASIKRHCLFSPLALEWLARCAPVWSRLDSYSSACVRQCGAGPKVLQKSAAQHLTDAHEADADDVELLLGHVRGRLSVTYYRPKWQRLRVLASSLTV